MIAYDWEGKKLFKGTPLKFLEKYNEEIFATFN
jgi:hypothetical protein